MACTWYAYIIISVMVLWICYLLSAPVVLPILIYAPNVKIASTLDSRALPSNERLGLSSWSTDNRLIAIWTTGRLDWPALFSKSLYKTCWVHVTQPRARKCLNGFFCFDTHVGHCETSANDVGIFQRLVLTKRTNRSPPPFKQTSYRNLMTSQIITLLRKTRTRWGIYQGGDMTVQ